MEPTSIVAKPIFHSWPHWFRSQRASQLGEEYGFKEAHHKRFFGWKTFKKSMPELYAKTSMEELWKLMKVEKVGKKSDSQIGPSCKI